MGICTCPCRLTVGQATFNGKIMCAIPFKGIILVNLMKGELMQIEKPFPKEERLFPSKKEVLVAKIYQLQQHSLDYIQNSVASLGYKRGTIAQLVWAIRKLVDMTEEQRANTEKKYRDQIGGTTYKLILKHIAKHTAIWVPKEENKARKRGAPKKDIKVVPVESSPLTKQNIHTENQDVFVVLHPDALPNYGIFNSIDLAKAYIKGINSVIENPREAKILKCKGATECKI